MDNAAIKKEAWRLFKLAQRGLVLNQVEVLVCIDAYNIGGMDIFSDPNYDFYQWVEDNCPVIGT